MTNGRAIAAAAGLSFAMAAGAKPPLQLADQPLRAEPISIAPAWIENGKVVLGDWQPYAPVQTRGRKGLYYAFDALGGYVSSVASRESYVNNAHGGLGAGPTDTRWPGTTGCDPAGWHFPGETIPAVVEDIEAQACGSSGGFPIDAVDFLWYWGGGSCVISFFTSDDSAACSNGDPLTHDYSAGVALAFGSIPPGGFYFTNVDGLYSQYGINVPMPAPGGSYMATFTTDGSTLATGTGTQFALWGTGEDANEPYRAGTQGEDGWMDTDVPYGSFEAGECMSLVLGVCPDPLAPSIGFLALRCPADVNWDGFVNADDYDLFAENFDAANLCADLNGDGFVNGNDYDAFATWFDEGC